MLWIYSSSLLPTRGCISHLYQGANEWNGLTEILRIINGYSCQLQDIQGNKSQEQPCSSVLCSVLDICSCLVCQTPQCYCLSKPQLITYNLYKCTDKVIGHELVVCMHVGTSGSRVNSIHTFLVQPGNRSIVESVIPGINFPSVWSRIIIILWSLIMLMENYLPVFSLQPDIHILHNLFHTVIILWAF